jgi:hypothetical protein
MNPDEVIQYICDSVRKCFPQSSNIEFTEVQSGVRGMITRVRVDAWIGAGRLSYDQPELLQLLEADWVESDDGGDYALISGIIAGKHYELRLFAEPQVVSNNG